MTAQPTLLATERPEGAVSNTGQKACPHRKTEKRGGKTYCRECKRQLYL